MDDLTATVFRSNTAGELNQAQEEKESPRFAEGSPDVSPQKTNLNDQAEIPDFSTIVDNSALVVQTNVEEKQ